MIHLFYWLGKHSNQWLDFVMDTLFWVVDSFITIGLVMWLAYSLLIVIADRRDKEGKKC